MSRYGFVVSASRPEVAKGKVAFLDAVKAGGIVLFSYLICLPTLYVFASIAGCKVGFVRLALVGLVMLFRSPCALDDVATGNWSRLVRFAVVSLLCGLVWEMWNINSFTKWNYAIPYVHRFQYFEMPLLGLFGYIPYRHRMSRHHRRLDETALCFWLFCGISVLMIGK